MKKTGKTRAAPQGNENQPRESRTIWFLLDGEAQAA